MVCLEFLNQKTANLKNMGVLQNNFWLCLTRMLEINIYFRGQFFKNVEMFESLK